ncbi:MAG TPA: MauE/DoxX family redox-associated membrane protein [Polyangiaceae bacterium]|nr:MauE/DoxX family redox-associated membrane protein [Polyangiaceae bacterium]
MNTNPGNLVESKHVRRGAVLLLRFGLGTAFLSAVADRFGLYGPHGAKGASWGDFAHFIDYTRTLTGFVPSSVTPTLAWMATLLETLFGVLLLLGFRTRASAFASAILLLSFALAMSLAEAGPHSAFIHSVFSAAGGALLLSAVPETIWSVDALLSKGRSS